MGEVYVHGLFGPQKSRNQPNDNIYTPEDIARAIVDHFKPSGKILEPCAGNGVFLKYMPTADWCEIKGGRNFFEYSEKVDWIITNPPWSKAGEFLIKSMKIAKDIVFLMNIPGVFTVRRMREIYRYSFGIKEILLIRIPNTFPQSGRQLGAIHFKKGFKGFCKIIYHPDLIKSYSEKQSG